jgi:pimeloyl-ACP methyl ester carboxylesterase
MKSSVERAQYARFLQVYPLQSDRCGWQWVDSRQGSETLVILPGLMGEAGTSFLFVQALAPHLRVISVCYPPAIGRVDALGDSLADLLDELELPRVMLLGGSMSGFLAQAFLRRMPTRISSCILTHTGLPNAGHARTARFLLRLVQVLPIDLCRWLMRVSIYGYFPRPTAAQAFWREHFREVIRHQTRQTLASRLALMDDFHSHFRFQPGDLSGWPGRMLLMEMRRDGMTTPAEQAALRALYPNAKLRVFADTGHYDSIEHPGEQIDVIKAFLLLNKL